MEIAVLILDLLDLHPAGLKIKILNRLHESRQSRSDESVCVNRKLRKEMVWMCVRVCVFGQCWTHTHSMITTQILKLSVSI